jgi:hypothetical protein
LTNCLSKVKVKVALRLAVYFQSVRLGIRPIETHEQTYYFQLNSCDNGPYATSSLTRGWVCHLQFLLVLASTVILKSEFHETQDNMGVQVPVFISPRNKVARALGSIFVVSYDSQGYGGDIRTHLHTGVGIFSLLSH